MSMNAWHPHHQHRGDYQQGVVHGQPQQESVHRTRHCRPIVISNALLIASTKLDFYLERMTADKIFPIKPRSEMPKKKKIIVILFDE